MPGAGGNHGSSVLMDGETVSRLDGLNEVTVLLSDKVNPATVAPGCVTVVGAARGDVSSLVSGLGLDLWRQRLTIRFAGGLPDGDTYTIALTDALRNSSGETVGDGVSLAVSVLAGDVNGSGDVTAADMLAVRHATGSSAESAAAPCDVDNSGTVTGADMLAVRSRLGRRLESP